MGGSAPYLTVSTRYMRYQTPRVSSDPRGHKAHIPDNSGTDGAGYVMPWSRGE